MTSSYHGQLIKFSSSAIFTMASQMLDGDPTPPGTRVCSWCRKECEDEDEDLCRACFAAGDSGVVESTGEQLVAAARALGTICTPAAVPGTYADCSGYAVRTYPCGGRFSNADRTIAYHCTTIRW